MRYSNVVEVETVVARRVGTFPLYHDETNGMVDTLRSFAFPRVHTLSWLIRTKKKTQQFNLTRDITDTEISPSVSYVLL